MKTFLQELGQRLKEIRKNKKISQQKVAEKLFVDSLNSISRYENGKREMPLELLKHFAILYNVSSDYLLGISKEKQTLPVRNDEEIEIIEFFRKLTAQEKRILWGELEKLNIKNKE